MQKKKKFTDLPIPYFFQTVTGNKQFLFLGLITDPISALMPACLPACMGRPILLTLTPKTSNFHKF